MSWKVLRASVIGTSHIDSGLPCQDDCYADVIQSEGGKQSLVCIVSDGAGSAAEAATGAEIACITARQYLEDNIDNPLLSKDKTLIEELINQIQQSILNKSIENNKNPRDYACTLLGAAVSDEQGVFFQIGDGAIVIFTNSKQEVVFWPVPGVYANMTNFVTDYDALDHLHYRAVDDQIEEVSLLSDGLQNLALLSKDRVPYIPFFEPMFNVLRNKMPEDCDLLNDQLEVFLKSPNVVSRTDDDKTLILASRKMQ